MPMACVSTKMHCPCVCVCLLEVVHDIIEDQKQRDLSYVNDNGNSDLVIDSLHRRFPV